MLRMKITKTKKGQNQKSVVSIETRDALVSEFETILTEVFGIDSPQERQIIISELKTKRDVDVATHVLEKIAEVKTGTTKRRKGLRTIKPSQLAVAEDKTPSETKKQILQILEGEVERVKGNTAYLSFVDEDGNESVAEYDAQTLASLGIVQGEWLNCIVEKQAGGVLVRFEHIARPQMTKQDWLAIHKKTVDKLGKYDATDAL